MVANHGMEDIKTEFQPSISKVMPIRPGKHWDMQCEYHYKITHKIKC